MTAAGAVPGKPTGNTALGDIETDTVLYRNDVVPRRRVLMEASGSAAQCYARHRRGARVPRETVLALRFWRSGTAGRGQHRGDSAPVAPPKGLY